MPKSDLPFGSEFSPSQISLPRLLELSGMHGGDWHAFESAVYEEFFKNYPSSEANRRKLANNTKLSMQAYKIIDKDGSLTPLGRELHALRDDEPAMYAALAKHLLLNLHGVALLQSVQDMQAAGESVSLTTLRQQLENEYDVHFPRGGKHASTMRGWLEKAGVFADNGWRVDRDRLRHLLGISHDEIEALAMLSPEQRAFVRALVNAAAPGPYRSNEIERLATGLYGVKSNEKDLPRSVLYPLRDAGFITLTRGTREQGRGAKPFEVSPTAKLQTEVVEPLMKQLDRQVHPELRPLLRRPLADIRADLGSSHKHIRGLALEALAFKLMRALDLAYVGTRLRGTATGGAEADLVFEGIRLVFSRWQIQCKNTATVRLDAVAKEVGLTHMLKSNVIVMVSTGKIGRDARNYADLIMKQSNLCIVMLDGSDLDRIEVNPAALVDVLRREAQNAMTLKKIDIPK